LSAVVATSALAEDQIPVLLDVGTTVAARVNGYTVTGRVEDYEHYSRTQSTFPVSFGPVWRVMRRRDVTVLACQPADRRPPRRTRQLGAAPGRIRATAAHHHGRSVESYAQSV
jgi:hypothetical protein